MTDTQMILELFSMGIDIYIVKTGGVIETCTHGTYRLEFCTIKIAYDFHIAINK